MQTDEPIAASLRSAAKCKDGFAGREVVSLSLWVRPAWVRLPTDLFDGFAHRNHDPTAGRTQCDKLKTHPPAKLSFYRRVRQWRECMLSGKQHVDDE